MTPLPDDELAELERLTKCALDEIAAVAVRPYTKFPEDWGEQVKACPECQRYKGHPIQLGICDDHRRPLYARDQHDTDEHRRLDTRRMQVAEPALRQAANALPRLISELRELRASEQRVREALKPFARVGWMTDDTEHTARTVIAHMHPERERELMLSSADFYRALAALSRPASEQKHD